MNKAMLKKYGDYVISFKKLVSCRLNKTHVPLFAALGITNQCNYKCTYCYGDYYNQKKEYFSTEELKDIIDTLAAMGTRVINLIGGEPLLRNDLDLLVKRVKNNGMICNVSTNASLLQKKIYRLRNVDSIDTSLDGLEENNDKNRGKGTFQQTFEGIKCAVRNNIKTNVNMVLTRHNLNDVDAMVKLAVDTGFALSFNIVFESHSSEYKNYQDSINIKSKNDIHLKDTLQKIIKYKGQGYPIRFSKSAYRYALNWPRPYSEGVYVIDRVSLKDFKPIKCYFTRFHCYIDTDGRMYNCMHIKDMVPVVNVKTLGLRKSWEKISCNQPPCLACYTICNNDANMIFGLNPSTLISTIFDMIS